MLDHRPPPNVPHCDHDWTTVRRPDEPHKCVRRPGHSNDHRCGCGAATANLQSIR